ncbi:MAG TPA: undecaprenyl-diphosphatase [Anaerolineales bacterium]|nr:undecaprenyl-diphosphatase [Anaerolineales bacterium]HLO34302.1 undecaprenyl-diphosphatase [Anaerolineales bacterium]
MDVFLFQQINGLAGQNPWLDSFMTLCARYLPIVFAFFLIGLWLARQQRVALLAGVSALLALGIGQIFNGIFLRARPYTVYATHLLVDRTSDPSFPSDHTTLAFAIAALIWKFNRKVATVLLGLAILQGFARVYVGAHYPSDVVGGAVLGMLVSSAVGRASSIASVRHLIDRLFGWLAKWHITRENEEQRMA